MNKLPPLPKSSMNLPPLSPVVVKGKKKVIPKNISKTTVSSLPPLSKIKKSIEEKKRTLSGVKDVDLIILSNLNDKDLFSLCMVDKYTNNLCKIESFWMNRFINRFGDMAAKYKPENRSWRNHYLKVVSDLDEYSADPWYVLKNLSWNISKQPTSIQVIYIGSGSRNIKNDREEIKNLYWMLELGKDITLEFPVDTFGDMDYVKRRYKSDKEFTPAKVLQLVYDFYQEPVSRKELEMMQEEEVEFADEYELEDAEEGKIKRIDLMGDLEFFEGFTLQFLGAIKEDNVYKLSLGS